MGSVQQPGLKQQLRNLQASQAARLNGNAAKGTGQAIGQPVATPDADEFSLDLNIGREPPSLVSEELVEHLNGEIRELKDESGRLCKALQEKDFELNRMRKKKQQATAEMLPENLKGDAAAVRIVELSKKVRELTAELEGERSRTRQLTRSLRDAEHRVEVGSGEPAPIKDDPSQVTALQDKIRQIEGKMCEFRNTVELQKKDVRQMTKLLQQECGDKVDVAALLRGENAGWRGRAQTIAGLQGKLKQLQKQARPTSGISTLTNSAVDQMLLEQELGLKTGQPSVRSTTSERGYANYLRQLEGKQGERRDRLEVELGAVEAERDDLRLKHDAVKSRVRILSEELKRTKEQVTRLLEKGDHDDQLVSALLKKQKALQESISAGTEQPATSIVRVADAAAERALVDERRVKETALVDLVKLGSEKEMLGSELKVTQEQLVVMREQLLLTREQLASANRRVQQTFHVTDPLDEVTSPVEGDLVRDSLDLARPSSTTSQGRSAVKTTHGRQSTTPRAAHSSRPPSRAAERLESETVLAAVTVERDRLRQLVDVQERQAGEAATQVRAASSELVTLRHRCATLEKRAERFKMEAAGGRRAPHDVEAELEDLREQVDILSEERQNLRLSLDSIIRERQKDLLGFRETMEEAKTAFVNALRQKSKVNP